MGARSRRKGHAFEREVAGRLDAVGIAAKRNLTECREGNTGDLECEAPLTVQCKVGQRPNVLAAVREAEAATSDSRRFAVAIVRQNALGGKEKQDVAAMPLADWLELVGLLRAHGVW